MSKSHREEIVKSAKEMEKAWHWTEHAKKRPYCCPVCNGVGEMPAGFYGMTTTSNVSCRSCTNGVIWG